MNEQLEKMLKEIKFCILDVLPLTLIGFVLATFVSVILSKTNLDFTVQVAKTGISIIALYACYIIGTASHLLINELLSRFTHAKRTEETQ